jgi:hypothetical protein
MFLIFDSMFLGASGAIGILSYVGTTRSIQKAGTRVLDVTAV